ncbi:kinase [Cytobacillus sp. IB215316]|uniref:kinase n=1 Tax=Cytobacillus sp. IB215316 TaxID=3097354 RepID=UPI002A11DE18|nr:kinase [Cytobacillus sp. IB215316]MDX8360742.1 kinase [Cytobacillus sp. IB215316]
MDHSVNSLIQLLTTTEYNNRFIIGIDGLSRSGKTTLVSKLSHHLQELNIPYHIFHIDDHIVERKNRYNTGQEEWYEYYHLQWNKAWLKEHFFKQLKHATELNLPYYEGDSDSCNVRSISLPKNCVIIIEGVFLQRYEWREFYDYVVYLDCPRDHRFLRESTNTQRNITKFKNRYWKAEAFYLQNELPEKKADLILQN